jgi:hypothetical protein
MPTYVYSCEHHGEFEEFHSITIKLEFCPKCKAEGKEECDDTRVKRLVSGGSGRGIVELAGQDLVDSVKVDVQKLKRDMTKDEKLFSNLLGESKYQQMQTNYDKSKRDRGR